MHQGREGEHCPPGELFANPPKRGDVRYQDLARRAMATEGDLISCLLMPAWSKIAGIHLGAVGSDDLALRIIHVLDDGKIVGVATPQEGPLVARATPTIFRIRQPEMVRRARKNHRCHPRSMAA